MSFSSQSCPWSNQRASPRAPPSPCICLASACSLAWMYWYLRRAALSSASATSSSACNFCTARDSFEASTSHVELARGPGEREKAGAGWARRERVWADRTELMSPSSSSSSVRTGRFPRLAMRRASLGVLLARWRFFAAGSWRWKPPASARRRRAGLSVKF